MKEKALFAIIIKGDSGIETTLILKTWRDVLSAVTNLQSDCPNIWSDAFCVSIYSLDGVSNETLKLFGIKEV